MFCPERHRTVILRAFTPGGSHVPVWGRFTTIIRNTVDRADSLGATRTHDLSATYTPDTTATLVVDAENGSLIPVPARDDTLTVDAVARTTRDAAVEDQTRTRLVGEPGDGGPTITARTTTGRVRLAAR